MSYLNLFAIFILCIISEKRAAVTAPRLPTAPPAPLTSQHRGERQETVLSSGGNSSREEILMYLLYPPRIFFTIKLVNYFSIMVGPAMYMWIIVYALNCKVLESDPLND